MELKWHYEALLRARRNAVNRTKVELKCSSLPMQSSPGSAVNRTKVELKYEETNQITLKFRAVNRTKVELKFKRYRHAGCQFYC